MSSKQKFKLDELEKVYTSQDMEEYFSREYTHTKYFHYTSLDILEKILKDKMFWISSVKEFNDENDKSQFENKDVYFSLCFSTGINENLPLWYLYSGIDGKGANICFTSNKIKKLINNSTYTLCEIENNVITREICVLNENDMDISFKDIVYYQYNNEYVSLKYNNQTSYNKITVEEFEKFRLNNVGIFKSLIWFYEKETRILIKLKNDVCKKLHKNKEYVITLNFGHLTEKDFKIKLAPEIDSYEYIYDKTYLKEYLEKSSRIEFSKYKGEIKMNLCKKCQKRGK